MPNGLSWWSLTVIFRCGSGISPANDSVVGIPMWLNFISPESAGALVPAHGSYRRLDGTAHLHRTATGRLVRPVADVRQDGRGLRVRRLLPLRSLPEDGLGHRAAGLHR